MSELQHRQAVLFRRRRFEAPHRRRHPLRRLARPFTAAVAVVGLPALAVWWVLTSPEFEIRRIEVVATARVPATWVEQRLDSLRGRHLLAVRLSEIEHRLAEHPWIADLVVRRELPGRLAVAVIDKEPAALWNAGDRLLVLDRGGRQIAPLAAAGSLDLPVISAVEAVADGGFDPARAAAAIRVAARWESLQPNDEVSQIEVLRSGDFRLVTRELPFVVVVSAARLDRAAATLARALPLINQGRLATLPPARVASVDLRFSRQIVFQTAALPPREEG